MRQDTLLGNLQNYLQVNFEDKRQQKNAKYLALRVHLAMHGATLAISNDAQWQRVTEIATRPLSRES